MNTLHYRYNKKTDLLTIVHLSAQEEKVLGSITIANTSSETKRLFIEDMIAAKEKMTPTSAPWHANALFDAEGKLRNLSIRKYAKKAQWYLKRGNKVKKEAVKNYHAASQVEYYTQQILLQHNVPDNIVTYNVVKHAVANMMREHTFNRN